MTQALFLVLGLLAGAAVAMLAVRPRLVRLAGERDGERDERARLEREAAELAATLAAERRLAAERTGLKDEVSDAVRALSAEAVKELRDEARTDLDERRRAVETLLTPIRESLARVDAGTRELEQARAQAYGALVTQVRSLAETQEHLKAETANLVTALRAPSVRGRWGEIQLRRVVEAAGMLPYCDFEEQVTTSAEGRTLRPDLVVRLPGAKQVVVDAKTPLAAYIEAVEAKDEDLRSEHLSRHARQLRDHVAKLAGKAYWTQFQAAPDFVVLFVPGDAFLDAAVKADPALMEDAWRNRVLLATPNTLVGLLFAVAYGWRQERVAESARQVNELGRELYERLGKLAEHFVKLRRALDGAVGAYNDAVGSLELRVLAAARRFPDLGVPDERELAQLEPISQSTRALQAPELVAGAEAQRDQALPGPGTAPERTADDIPDAA